jgi:hypothetical protein
MASGEHNDDWDRIVHGELASDNDITTMETIAEALLHMPAEIHRRRSFWMDGGAIVMFKTVRYEEDETDGTRAWVTLARHDEHNSTFSLEYDADNRPYLPKRLPDYQHLHSIVTAQELLESGGLDDDVATVVRNVRDIIFYMPRLLDVTRSDEDAIDWQGIGKAIRNLVAAEPRAKYGDGAVKEFYEELRSRLFEVKLDNGKTITVGGSEYAVRRGSDNLFIPVPKLEIKYKEGLQGVVYHYSRLQDGSVSCCESDLNDIDNSRYIGRQDDEQACDAFRRQLGGGTPRAHQVQLLTSILRKARA